jgi:hypothetical protein
VNAWGKALLLACAIPSLTCGAGSDVVALLDVDGDGRPDALDRDGDGKPDIALADLCDVPLVGGGVDLDCDREPDLMWDNLPALATDGCAPNLVDSNANAILDAVDFDCDGAADVVFDPCEALAAPGGIDLDCDGVADVAAAW